MHSVTKKVLTRKEVILIISSDHELSDNFYVALHKLVGLHCKIKEYDGFKLHSFWLVFQYILKYESLLYFKIVSNRIRKFIRLRVIALVHNHHLRKHLWELCEYFITHIITFFH